MTKTVSAKIPDEMKAAIDREEINVSEVIREAIEDALTEQRREALQRDATTLRESVGGRVDSETVTEAVRETRRDN
ncbi:ribbon-helix-helix protein, CopG family [Halococcus salsus]|uniref:ribbon-helix-helix protein, CopG family n=1 Tax=Halococcus salsus TaxID=2162894 RepID=UPI0013577A8D|nr:ribbon-helix-helix protein, CopG family [Halococcus salsus]